MNRISIHLLLYTRQQSFNEMNCEMSAKNIQYFAFFAFCLMFVPGNAFFFLAYQSATLLLLVSVHICLIYFADF